MLRAGALMTTSTLRSLLAVSLVFGTSVCTFKAQNTADPDASGGGGSPDAIQIDAPGTAADGSGERQQRRQRRRAADRTIRIASAIPTTSAR